MLKKVHIYIIILTFMLAGVVAGVHMMVPSAQTSGMYNFFASHWRWIGSALCLALSAWLQIVHFRLKWAVFFILMSVAFLFKLPSSLPGGF